MAARKTVRLLALLCLLLCIVPTLEGEKTCVDYIYAGRCLDYEDCDHDCRDNRGALDGFTALDASSDLQCFCCTKLEDGRR